MGKRTQIRMGGVTDGSTKERQFSQLFGLVRESGYGLLAFEYYDRDRLDAAARSQATSDLRAFGGSNFDAVSATILSGGQTYAIPRGQNGTALNPARLVPGTQNYSDLWQGATVLPRERRISVLASYRQVLSDRATLFVDALGADRSVLSTAAGYATALSVPASNPFYVNPSGGTTPVTVLYNFRQDFGSLATDADVKAGNLMAGVDWEVPSGWTVRGSAGLSLEHERQTTRGFANSDAVATALADPDPATAFNPFGDGSYINSATLAAIRTQTRYLGDSTLKLAQLHAGGPILSLPGGALKLAVGLDYRGQQFDFSLTPINPSPTQRTDLRRQVIAAFGELRLPVIGADNRLPGVERLEFSAALRHEHYSDVGGATTPQFGFSWAPADPVSFRGTWSRAFRAPNLPDRVESANTSGILALPDATAPGHKTQTLIWTGNNAGLQAERGHSWTLGLDLKADSLPGLVVGLTYFNTRLIDRVESTPFSFAALEDPLYSALVTRDPTPAERAAVCSRSSFQGTADACLNSPIGAVLDLRLRNAATVTTRGMDLNAEYRVPRVPGQLKLGLLATELFEFSRADLAGGPTQNLLNTENQPIDLRLRGSASWEYHGFGVAGFVNYTDSYRQFVTDSTRTIPSWTTLDLRLSMNLGDSDAGSGTQLSLNVQNLFNRMPPFVNDPVEAVGYDQENGDLLGRLVSFNIKFRW